MPSFDFVLVKQEIKTISADAKNAADNGIAAAIFAFLVTIGQLSVALVGRKKMRFA